MDAPEIPFLDLKTPHLELRAELEAAFRRVLESGWYILGRECEAFEAEFHAALGGGRGGRGGVAGVNSGTDAIALALRASGVTRRNNVALPANTAIPTASAVASTGAAPLFVDIDPDTWQISIQDLARRAGPETKAVIPVHLYGATADVEGVREAAGGAGGSIVEDVAQAYGALLPGGAAAGTAGRFGAFSFYPSKNLGALGDAGAVYSDSAEGLERVRRLRNYGQDGRYHAAEPGGLNSRLDEAQAALLRVKLARTAAWNAERVRLADRYRAGLAELAPRLRTQAVAPGSSPAWHLMVVRVQSAATEARKGGASAARDVGGASAARDALAAHLARRGVGMLIHYPIPLHRQPAFSDFAFGPLPEAERHCAEALSLPLYPGLGDAAVDRVLECVREWVKST